VGEAPFPYQDVLGCIEWLWRLPAEITGEQLESSCIAYDSHGVVKCASPSRNYCLSFYVQQPLLQSWPPPGWLIKDGF